MDDKAGMGCERFQTFGKIINAFTGGMEFDRGVNRIGQYLYCVPACNGKRFGGLIIWSNQNGADL
jgi:hypothetical protein